MILAGFSQKEKSAVVWYANKHEYLIMKAWPPQAHFRTAVELMDVGVYIDTIMHEYELHRKEQRANNKRKRAVEYARRKAQG